MKIEMIRKRRVEIERRRKNVEWAVKGITHALFPDIFISDSEPIPYLYINRSFLGDILDFIITFDIKEKDIMHVVNLAFGEFTPTRGCCTNLPPDFWHRLIIVIGFVIEFFFQYYLIFKPNDNHQSMTYEKVV